jgi:hypothetical protein
MILLSIRKKMKTIKIIFGILMEEFNTRLNKFTNHIELTNHHLKKLTKISNPQNIQKLLRFKFKFIMKNKNIQTLKNLN